ncbi:protein CHAPERONE-LIKE PROTEIN OF POR1, chloroplastic-like [Musa acuminata AAA Group]|uniref:protein CHAPERONE-LIKE PROTEIN OF POR1, chloroplastic-like n=1 Tax=Musa acuminata AAA Group TaxID=214697 RepID=UPI0031E03B89
MVVSCLSSNPSRISCCVTPIRASNSFCRSASPLPCNLRFKDRITLLSSKDSKYGTSLTQVYILRRPRITKKLVHASFGDMAEDSPSVFPRIHVKDPYKRLGISREASEEEIQAARNFLVKKYAGHKPSVDAIESAHDRIIMQSLYDRRSPKINLKKKVREVTQSRVVKAVTSRFEAPSMKIILKTAAAFIVLGVLTVLFPTEEGPTLQVAISLIASIYFIYDRLKNGLRAFLYGIGAFFASWLLGTFLMVSVMPPLLQGPRSLEVSTSLLSYVLLWVSSTYLR